MSISDFQFFRWLQPVINFYRRLKFLRIILLLGVIFMIFFDENSLIKRVQYKIKIIELQKEIDYYKEEIENSKRRLNELNSNTTNLEKFAREQFYMKKDNEDVYLIDKNE